MDLELTYQYPSPPQGWIEECEQDFCEWAKALKPSDPVYSLFPSTSTFKHLDDWMEIRDALGGDVLEAFSDVVLPEVDQFGPDDLFKHLEASPFIEHKPLSPAFSPASESSLWEPLYASGDLINGQTPLPSPRFDSVTENSLLGNQINLQDETFPGFNSGLNNSTIWNMLPSAEENICPSEIPRTNITIKLKKVKCPKKRCRSKILSTKKEISFADDNCANFIPDQISEVNNEHFIQASSNQELLTDFNPITLKDALSLEESDCILDDYLTSPSQEIVSDEGASSSVAYSPNPSEYSDSEKSIFPYDDFHMISISSPEHQHSSMSSGGRKLKEKHKLSPESKYLKKKEQNKQAALRYRAKKKKEECSLLGYMKVEEERKEELQQKYDSIKQEIMFMRKLLRETYIAKKLVPPNAFD